MAFESSKSRSFPVVAVAATAGGREALRLFCSDLGIRPGMALIIVQHRDHRRGGLLFDDFPVADRFVQEASDGLEIKSDQVYLSPPGKMVRVSAGRLRVSTPDSPRTIRSQIDVCFESLAAAFGDRAAGVLLSGKGTDGTRGLRAIKEAGGLTLVQDPAEAGNPRLPESAIKAGLADLVLPAADIPAALLERFSHSYFQHVVEGSTPAQTPLKPIFELLRRASGHDFSHYKETTVRRRIERRMAVLQLEDYADYVSLIEKESVELQSLFHDLLIGVTRFFRDPAAFAALAGEPLESLVRASLARPPLRVWVPGCATGEEAYSIAMLLAEELARSQSQAKFQLFATDIDPVAIDFARAGRYPASVVNDIGPERLKRFFIPVEDGYRVRSQIRESVIFSTQSIIKDPPFSRLDLISCRNLLIYLDSELQKRLLPLFHFALRPEGILFLGSSESVGQYTNLFKPVDAKAKIFRRAEAFSRGALMHPELSLSSGAPRERSVKPVARDVLAPKGLAELLVLSQYAPPGVLVNEDLEILFFLGDTDPYLRPPRGEAHFDAVRMARDGLQHRLGAALRKAVATKVVVAEHGIQISAAAGIRNIDFVVRPLHEVGLPPGLLLVLFEDRVAPLAEEALPSTSQTDPKVLALEGELRSTREHLQTTIEELETSNEELKSSNEELQSVNEELQSTNEELETSKEELESTNEELVTVNSELQDKVHELARTSDDINNLFAATDIGTIFLDVDMCVKRYTPAATRIFNLIAADIGRPINHITSRFADYSVVEDARVVLDSLNTQSRELQDREGRNYSVRVAPYRTVHNVIEGVVITMVDVSEVTHMKSVLGETEKRLRTVLRGSPISVARLDRNLRYIWIHNTHPDFRPEVSIGKLDTEIVDCEGTRRLLELKTLVLTQGVEVREKITLSLSDGARTFDFFLEPERGTAGDIIGVTSVAWDTTT